MGAGTWRHHLPDDYQLPPPYNPRDWDSLPWPKDAGDIPKDRIIPEEVTDASVEEYFEGLGAGDDEGSVELSIPWPNGIGDIPYERFRNENNQGDDMGDNEGDN